MDVKLASLSNLIPLLTVVLGALGLLISGLIYVHYRQQRSDAWLKDFRRLHWLFWEDSDLRIVRGWLSVSDSYQSIAGIFYARRTIAERNGPDLVIPANEYREIERFDKFLNLLVAIQALNPRFRRHRKLWKRVFFEYWLLQIEHRRELHWYVEHFYPSLARDIRAAAGSPAWSDDDGRGWWRRWGRPACAG